MTRARWFCSLCGALTAAPAVNQGRYYCRAHSHFAALVDAVPPDPLESLPMQAAEIHRGEVVSPADGTERC